MCPKNAIHYNKITESKENNSIHRLNLSGSTGPGASSFPLLPPASYGSGSARARKEVVAIPVNSIKLINFLSFFFQKKSVQNIEPKPIRLLFCHTWILKYENTNKY